MHILAINSVSTLLTYLSEQVKRTPSQEEIQAMQLGIPQQLTEEEAEMTLAERKEQEKVTKKWNMLIKGLEKVKLKKMKLSITFPLSRTKSNSIFFFQDPVIWNSYLYRLSRACVSKSFRVC